MRIKHELKPRQRRPYRHMTWTDRLKIEALYNAGHTYRFIAEQLGYCVSSIHTEIQRGLYAHLGAELTKRPIRYSAQIAQDISDDLATAKGVQLKLGHNYAYAKFVADGIKNGYSPDSIVGELRRKKEWTVSTSTLYRYIANGYIPGVTRSSLAECLTRKRNKKITEKKKAARPPKGESIERRPEEISSRRTFGHWEMDSVIGKAQGVHESILVLTERKTRYEIIIRTHAKTASATVDSLKAFLPKFPKEAFKSITVDNGTEFSDCKGMENLGVKVYYCHPYSSYERGSNERQNRIIRRFFPKGISMSRRTQKECDRVAAWINAMPRKILGYATSAELFAEELAKLV